jgi:predicted ATP-grasp superfamily ATP-dependent carboligase
MAPIDLLIVGASARAAAESARRAGFHPWCADLFRDADLACWAPGSRCSFEDYPYSFIHLLETSPEAPWLYTGGLENYPDLIDQLQQIRPLWGNHSATLRAVRSPFRLNRRLEKAGFEPLRVLPTPPDSGTGRWLKKPIKGSAGLGISWDDGTIGAEHYYQEFAEGPSLSAQMVACRGEAILLGVTEQLIGTSWLHARAFQYAGNIGPVAISTKLKDNLLEAASYLVTATGLRGLFGVDFILQEDRPRIVEINPRYTAAMEVIERASGVPVLAWHQASFDDRVALPDLPIPSEVIQGKAILYASQTHTIPASFTSACLKHPDRFADIPNAGEHIEAGWPILTLLATGSTPLECEQKLQQTAFDIEATFSLV